MRNEYREPLILAGKRVRANWRTAVAAATVDFGTLILYNSITYLKSGRFGGVKSMLSEIPEDEFAAAIDACAAEVLWEAGVDRAAGRRTRGCGTAGNQSSPAM